MSDKPVKIPHHAAYQGPRDALATATPDGIRIDNIGYYEESITITHAQLSELGYVRRMTATETAQLRELCDCGGGGNFCGHQYSCVLFSALIKSVNP